MSVTLKTERATETYKGSSFGSQPSSDNLQYAQVARSLLSSFGQKYHPPSTIYSTSMVRNVGKEVVLQSPCSDYQSHLVRLTSPAALSIVRPCFAKGSLSRLYNALASRVFDLGGVGAVLLNVHHYSPSTVRSMFQMFRDRVVLFLPSV